MKALFLYLSTCCKQLATKPPCVKGLAFKKKGQKETKAPEVGLGHWSCTGCGRACKVSRTNAPEEKKDARI